ncbi:MAG: T9SS type A sorting domain-containing protein [Flavobacteriales bacterium]|nr:T9SS type A sorting domain-containing protein [Flavobacteriales bacterium]
MSYAAQPVAGALEVRDLSGRLVLKERLPQWSQVHRVDLAGEASGMYHCTLRWGMRSASTRIIVQAP